MLHIGVDSLAATVQSIAVTVGVIAGGVWAWFRFRALNEQARAAAELDRLRLSNERRASLNVNISATPAHANGRSALVVNVMITNIGTRSEVIDWTSSRGGVWTARVDEFKEGAPVLGDCVYTPLVTASTLLTSSIEPGVTDQFPFLVPIQRAGLYYVEFRADRSVDAAQLEMQDHRRTGVDLDTYSAQGFSISLGAITYVQVAGDISEPSSRDVSAKTSPTCDIPS
jgi:hypothetical protein